MAKKASKKKAKKAKKAGKPKRMAQRKPARKTSRKTARKTTPTAVSTTIKYRCVGGAGGNCTATPRSAHMRPGATVTLEAVNTDVTITFGAKGSPFQPPTNPLSITAGTTLSQVVDPSAAGAFTYVLSCSQCARQSQGPPEMIVP